MGSSRYLNEVCALIEEGGPSTHLIEELRDWQKFCGKQLKNSRRFEEIIRGTVFGYGPGPDSDFWKDQLLYFGYLIAALRAKDRKTAEEYVTRAGELRNRYRRSEGIRCFR